MITDFHTHIFPDRIAAAAVDKLSRQAHITPFTDARASSLLASMRRAGIGRSVILPVATSPGQVEKLNDAAAGLNERCGVSGASDRAGSSAHGALPDGSEDGSGTSAPVLHSFGAMHPDYENWHAELARISALGLRGVKVHPAYQGTDIDDISYLRIFSRCAELGLIVVTHAGLDIGFPGVVRCSPAMCRRVCDRIGSFPFVLAHMGGWRNWDEVPDLLSGTGAYIDTAFSSGQFSPLGDGWWDGRDISMLDAGAFMKVIRAFGTDHVLFGTDSPWSDQAGSLDFLRSLPLTAPEIDQILGRNADRLLGGDAEA